LPERIVFRIENAQVDEVHKSRTIPREDGMRTFEHFLLRGERHPRLKWVEQPGDLWEPAEPSAAADHGDTEAYPGS
jgi:hypothetical protein